MNEYFIEIYEAARTPDDEGGCHNCVDELTVFARSPVSAMQKAVKHCRELNISPCEIRILRGHGIEAATATQK